MDEMIKIIEYARRKQTLIMKQKGNPSGLIASDEYLYLLIEEIVQQRLFSQYCASKRKERNFK